MSTTFGVKIPTVKGVVIVAYRGNGTGMFWKNPLAPYLPDDMEVIPLDNSAQGVSTIGDIKNNILNQRKYNKNKQR